MAKTTSTDIAYAAILTAVNIILLAVVLPPTGTIQITFLSNTLVFLFLVAFIGYGLGKIGDGTLILAETISLVFIMVHAGGYLLTWTFIRDQVLFSLLIFAVGIAVGSSFFKNIHLDLKLRLSREHIDHRTVLVGGIGIAGFTLLLTYLVSMIGELSTNPLIYALPATRYGLLFSLLNGTILTILLGDELISKPLLTILGSVLVYLSGLSVPLVIAVVRLRRPEYVISKRQEITLGTIIRKLKNSRWIKGRGKLSIGIELGKENNHVVVVGASGTGKSYLCKKIISQLRRYDIPVLVIDVHGEYGSIEEANIITPIGNPINILDDMGKMPEVRAREVADLISTAFRLGNVQRLALMQLISELYMRKTNPTLDDLEELIEEYLTSSKELGSFDKEVLKSLLPYVRSLRPKNKLARWVLPEEILGNKVTVVDLSVVNDMSLIKIYVETLLESVFHTAQLMRRGLFIVIEEVHRFSSKGKKSIIPRLFMEGRKFGIAVVAVTQDPLSVEPAVFTNTKVIISYVIPEASSSSYMARIFSGNDLVKYKKLREVLTSLKQFEALVWIRGDENVYVVKT
ncbi:MAG: hypothetical protein DRO14_00865 [Thermoprotei archaeon]|nr:MAG: hypothetical protein DRO14_00865 [Thermoprotei archaeon]